MSLIMAIILSGVLVTLPVWIIVWAIKVDKRSSRQLSDDQIAAIYIGLVDCLGIEAAESILDNAAKKIGGQK